MVHLGQLYYLNHLFHRKLIKSFQEQTYKNWSIIFIDGKSSKRHINYQIDNETTDKCSGISYSRKNIVTLYGEKIKLLKHLNYHSHGDIKNNKLNVTLNVNLKDKWRTLEN